MKYLDKEVIRLRNEQRKSRYKDSSTGMYAGEVLIEFERMMLYPGISAMIPKGFQDMEFDMVVKKYPSEKRPQVIKTDEEGEINFTFSLFHEPISRGQIEGTLEQFKILIQVAQPANQFMDGGDNWMDFKSHSLDGQIYNVLSITGFQDYFLLGMFNIPYDKWVKWKPIALEVLKTIRLEEETDESSSI